MRDRQSSVTPPKETTRKEASRSGTGREGSGYRRFVVGAPIVHSEYGIGRYAGLVQIDTGAGEASFVAIDYAHEERLYVPLGALDRIVRYRGDDDGTVSSHELDGAGWPKLRRRVAERESDASTGFAACEKVGGVPVQR